MCFDVGRIMCRAPAKDKESRKKEMEGKAGGRGAN
jgi:hypothetical protein